MWSGALRKILLWIPAIFVLCLVSFLLLQFIPGDPVLARLQESGVYVRTTESVYESEQYRTMRQELGLDLPVFYWTFQPVTIPDSLRQIPHPQHREILKKWCIKTGKPELIFNWYQLNKEILTDLRKAHRKEEHSALLALLHNPDSDQQTTIYRWLANELAVSPIGPKVIRAAAIHQIIMTTPRSINSYLPVLKWNGHKNQFHRWIWGFGNTSGVLRGDFGFSTRDGQPVSAKIWPAFKTTLALALTSIVLMYLIAVPLGLRLARMKNTNSFKIWIRIIFGLYAMPSFWLGVLLLTFLTNPKFLNWFPAAYSLMDIQQESSWIEKTALIAGHLILPVTAWSIGGAAFLSIQTLKQAKHLQRQPFVMAARAKGLSEHAVSKNHLFKNALVPAVSMIGSIMPAALSGAIAIELIFSIPGMGQLIFHSFHTRDYPVVMAILILVGTVAIIGSALSDLILHRIDPRIRKSQPE